MGVLEVRYGEGTFLSENTSLLTDHFKISHLLKRFSVMDLVEARKVVEGATVYLAAKRGSPEDREALQDIYHQAEEAVRKDKGEKAFLKADFEFHKKIAEMCKNPVLLEMLDTVRELTLTENLDVIKKTRADQKRPCLSQRNSRGRSRPGRQEGKTKDDRTPRGY
jgi:GntR family transcriptional repressor for pyruvate dehydrogenase complex